MRKSIPLLLLFALVTACSNKSPYPIVTTFAGSGTMGQSDGKGHEASFANLMAVATDTSGNVYVADSHNNLIRKITPAGLVTTLAGSGAVGSADGKGAAASFFNPAGIAVDKYGYVYVADTHNSLIRKITPDGVVTTIAGRRPAGSVRGKDGAVWFDNPAGIAVDPAGNIFVADWANDLIRKITPAGAVSTLAGNGTPGAKDGVGDSASFYLPWGIAADTSGNLYVSDSYNNMIRKITPSGNVTTLAGKKAKGSANGKGTAASFLHPAGIAVDNKGYIYVADAGNNKIRKISPGGMVTTFAGCGLRGLQNGRDTTARFLKPYGVAIDKRGVVYVADYLNNVVRKICF